MLSPLVSVIIPVYNVKPYLREAIDSVVNQSYSKLDIILVDDGSTDGSGIVCDQYQKIDSRVRVIHQSNCGLSAARNVGLNLMNGEIVAFLDPDDVYELHMIESMLSEMISSKSDIVICGYSNLVFNRNLHTYNTIGCCQFKRKHLLSKEALFLLFNGCINISVWNKIYKSELFRNLRFPEGVVYEGNYVIPFLFEKANSILIIEEVLMKHRSRSNSITSVYSEKNMLNYLASRKIRQDFVFGRTPEIFSLKQMRTIQEIDFCGLIEMYLCYTHKGTPTKKVEKIFKIDIKSRARNIRFFTNKTKILYITFRINPILYLNLRCFYNGIRRLTEHFSKRDKYT